MRGSSSLYLTFARRGATGSRTRHTVPPHWSWSSSSVNLPGITSSLEDDDRQQRHAPLNPSEISVRAYHTSTTTLYRNSEPLERSAVALAMGLGAVSAGAYAASSMVKAYNEWQASRPEPSQEKETKADNETTAKAEGAQQETKKEETKKEGPRENIFSKWFEVGSKYYEGGFEDTMTKREAALILGVRESSSAQRIKEAHRKLLILNHPDTGGSTFVAGKINEAKELLLKGKAKR